MRAVKVLAFALIIAATVAKAPAADEIASYSFEQYVADFRRPYTAGTQEYAMRQDIFEMKKKAAVAHNADAVKGRLYKKGINQFSDRTESEVRARNGGKIHEKWQARVALDESPLKKSFKASGIPVPDSVDWRSRVPSIFTGVKDQGQCGSCWAHASTETLESHWALRTGQLFTFSQQEINACTPNPNECGGTGGCNGGIAELAYEYAAQNGMAEEWTYPYTSYFGTTGECKTNAPKTIAKFTGYSKIAANDQDAVMEAIAFQGPLAVNVDASAWSDYQGGIYDGCDFAKNITIDHVVQLVGYGFDAGLQAKYWIIRNSWSPAWGENGYIRLIRHDVAKCGWDVNPQDGTACKGSPNQLWTCGQCGVLFDTSFPTVA